MEVSQIHRFRTAIGRTQCSRPIRLAVEAGLISEDRTVFDYGCGRGHDLKLLRKHSINADGWDPHYRPAAPIRRADVVNLGFVVNVIENLQERTEAALGAWELAERVLLVAARLKHDARRTEYDDFADGGVSSRDTFQKLYDQSELREWIDTTLGVSSVPAAPGVFFVFRHEEDRQAYLASRYRRQRAAPKIRKSDVLFEQHRELLEPLVDFVTGHGRLPAGSEVFSFQTVAEEFGSLKQAFALIRRVTGKEQWDEIRQQRTEELLLYFALDRFSGRPKLSDLPEELQLDVKDFFGAYTRACTQADALLFEAGNMDRLNLAMEESPVGKRTGAALYVHVDALHLLPLLLRVYEGCGRVYVGQVEDANIIKLNRIEPKVTYLEYPEFDTDPHPALHRSMRAALGWCDIKWRDFTESNNPPILHRKETFLAPDDPRFEKFARLTKQEERYGLYDEPSIIGTREGWESVLEQRGVTLRGHRVVRR